MKAAFFTLGCKVNQYDTHAMMKILKNHGYEIVDFSQVADVYIVNSCTVTGTGDKKSRQMLARAKKTNPNAVFCMAGCYAQTAKDEVAALGVDIILGTNNRSEIATVIEKHLQKKDVLIDISKDNCFEELSADVQEGKTRAFLKIQDGCNRFCTYCIIPFARGNPRSKDMEALVSEAKALANNGYLEIVLTGIHLASYGIDNGESLIDAIKNIAKIDGIKRIRLGSLEPLILTKEFCKELFLIKKLCPSFHVSLQSGSDNTLSAMKRRYTTKEYGQFVYNLKETFNNPAISTDVMVGFPGETDTDFCDSFDFVKKMAFSKVHVFPFSKRSGTKAAEFINQITNDTKTKRAKTMGDMVNSLEKLYMNQHIGMVMDVLFEQKIEKDLYCGYTNNYIKVFVKGENLENKILSCKLNQTYKDGILGKLTN